MRQGATATVQQYIEYLRRQDNKRLLQSLEQSEARQKEVEQQIQQLHHSIIGRLTQLPDKLSDLVLQNLFDFDTHKLSRDDTAFEEAYFTHIRKRYGRLRTLGVRELRELDQDLSVAYVSLNMSSSSEGMPPRQAELLLHANPMLTIRGSAGSGKTTLLSWIATQCTKSNGLPNPWTGGVPFVVPLRKLPDEAKGRPKGTELLSYSVDPDVFTTSAPRGWLDRVLQEKRAVLLIDGVDEIAATHRPGFWEWLRDWVEAHPGNRCYVTSRFFADTDHSKSRASWNPPPYFASAQVQEMDEDDIRAFIERWHKAVSDTELDAAEKAAIEKAGAVLPTRLFDPANRRVRDLCRNPLLCALVCALHWREEGYLPSRRSDLYDRCCKMLLEERDRKREIKPPEGALGRLSLADKEMLLQRLAWQMMSNAGRQAEQRIEIDREQAVRWLKPHLKSCDNVECRNCDPSEVLNHLIDRTGLLRTPAKDRVDFPHRTFQEYLAACAAGYYDDAGALAKRSMNDQWHETIVLAAGTPVGGSAFGNRLIEELLHRGMTLRQPRARNLSLALALACLETGKQIKPELRKRVLEQLSKLVPPSTEVIARQLSVAGDALLPHLEYSRVKPHGLRAIALSASAIARVETNRAREVLLDTNGYGGDTRLMVAREICGCSLINPLEVLGIRKRLRLDPRVRRIPWFIASLLRSVKDLSPIANSNDVFFLELARNRHLKSFAPLRTIRNLTSLNLAATTIKDRDLEGIDSLTQLVALVLDNTEITDAGVQQLQNLRSLLHLSLTGTQVTDAGLKYLQNLTSLERLSLDRTEVSGTGLSYLEDLHQLVTLSLGNTQFVDAGLAQVKKLSALRNLSLEGTRVTNSGIEHLKDITNLHVLSLDRTRVSDVGLSHLQNLIGLVSLSLERTEISDAGLAYLKNLSSLETLFLAGTKVSDAGLLQLEGLPSLRILVLNRANISPAAITRLRRAIPIQRIVLQEERPSGERTIEEIYVPA